MPVASIATVSIRQSFSHWAISSRSGVLVPKRRTDSRSRSEGTQTKISRAPISIPAALGLIFSQFSSSAIFLNFLFFGWACLFFMFWGFSPRMKEEGNLLNGIAPHATSVWSFTNDLLALLGTRLTYGHMGTIGEHGHN